MLAVSAAAFPGATQAAPPAAARTSAQAYVIGGFTVATFNVLGASHTRRGGTYPAWPSGVARTGPMVRALLGRGVEVVGFQEMQLPQRHAFVRLAGATYRIFSAPHDTDNAVAWRRDTFAMASARTVGIPYFGGHRRPMPVVQLVHRATGQRLYVMSVHNPTHRKDRRWRVAATRKEVRVLNRLTGTGLPVVLTGDANARWQFFCRIAGGTTMESAFGGSYGATCRPPAYRGIDWIFGAPTTAFTSTRVDWSLCRRRVSDHPLVTSQLHYAVPVQ